MITYYLFVYGLTWFIVHSKAFEAPALWLSHQSEILNEMLDCMICTSFWVGLFTAACFYGISLQNIAYAITCIAFTNIVGTLIGDVK